jgi:hypothetical protein
MVPLDGFGVFPPERLKGEGTGGGGGFSPAKAIPDDPVARTKDRRIITVMRFERHNNDRGGWVAERNIRFTIRNPPQAKM